jgi:hypothetical protein
MKVVRKMAAIALSLFLLASASLFPAPVHVQAANPYLPLWEHLPDGEPRVFEDPDNPGQYRAYIFGSHDLRYTSYCGPDIRAWSAPVEDLTNWRDEGPVFSYYINGQWDVFYAPDITEVVRKDGTKEYYLYPHSRGSNRIAMVCKGASPVGPFEPINLNAAGTATVAGSVLGFDPAVWIEYVTDPADPDYDIGFRAYAYWGYAGSTEKSWACQLDQNTMYSARPGTTAIQYFMPCSSGYGNINDPAGTTYPYIYPDEDLSRFNFFEASSIRKVGNKYIMIYSGYSGPDYGLGSTNSALRYCFGDTPLGPWRSGGVLVDSRAPVSNESGSALTTSYSGHNTHGSLCQINGQWYVYYHRAARGYGYARQPMVAPVHIVWDDAPVAKGGKVAIRAYDPYSPDSIWTAKAGANEYTGAEVTSEGFEIFGLDPYKYHSAGYACYLSSTGTQQDSFDIWRNDMPITNVANGHRIGYKYFGFGGLSEDTKGIKAFEGTKPGNNTKFNLFLTPRTANAFKINVWLDGPWEGGAWDGTKIGEINVPADSAQVMMKYAIDVSSFVDNLDEKHALFLVAEGAGTAALCDISGLGFSSDAKEIEAPTVSSLSISVDGTPIALPTAPVRSTNANGIVGYDMFEVDYARSATETKAPVISAESNDKDIKITITQPTSPFGVGVVRFNKGGVVKTYRVSFSASGSLALSDGVVVNPRDPDNPTADIASSGETVTIQSKPGEGTGYRYPQTSNILQLPYSVSGDWTATVTITMNLTLRGSNGNTGVANATNAGIGLRDPDKGTVESLAEYCYINAEKISATYNGTGSRTAARMGGVRDENATGASTLGNGPTYTIRIVKAGTTVAVDFRNSANAWVNLRSFAFGESFFDNAKFELFVHNPSSSTDISAQFSINMTRAEAYKGEEIPDVQAVEQAADVIGNHIAVQGRDSDEPWDKAAKAEQALMNMDAIKALGVKAAVSYQDDAFTLKLTKGATSTTVTPFGIETTNELSVRAVAGQTNETAPVYVDVYSGPSALVANLIVAAYKPSGELLSSSVRSIEIAENISALEMFTLDVSKADGDYNVKVFLWDNVTYVPKLTALDVTPE